MEQNRCPGCMKIKSGGVVCEHCGYDERIPNAPHQLQVGTVLQDRYMVGRVLGQGGFGITYLGWNRYLDTRVAVKEYYPSAFVERNTTHDTTVVCKTELMEGFFTENRMRFLREARTLARMQEVPQIVTIHDFFEVNNTAYIVMEYLRGEDLRSYVRKKGGRLTPSETFRIMRPVMAALAEVHEAGLVHRDISPDNIMLQPDGSVKLMDFGAVRCVNNPDVDKELTQATQAIVKHGFAPIEQYSAKGSIGPWSDEYALCATMFYCMTGKVPMNATDRIEEETEIDWDAIEGLMEQQKQILRKGAAIRAKDRYASIRELMNALFTSPEQMDEEQETVKHEDKKRKGKKQKEKKPFPRAPKKKMLLLITVVLLVAATIYMMIPNGWKDENGDWYYYEMGKMVTGWKNIDDGRYYFERDGKLVLNSQIYGGNDYYYDPDGNKMAGWYLIDGYRYYVNSNGRPAEGWQEIDGDKYYFTWSGKMIISSQLIDGERCYFDYHGKMLTGWQYYNDQYYFDDDGRMVTGWQELEGSKFFFDEKGRMKTGWLKYDDSWYYFDDDGKIVTGRYEIDGVWYEFGSDGRRIE